MSESNEPKKKAAVSNWIEDAARALHLSVEEIKKYRGDKPLRLPEPRKPQEGDSAG